jgi:hypothetical protein
MNTQIVLISVDHNNARKVCEEIQNMVFVKHTILLQVLENKLGTNDGFLTFSLNEFMDEVNDQNLDILTEFFMTYVKIG